MNICTLSTALFMESRLSWQRCILFVVVLSSIPAANAISYASPSCGVQPSLESPTSMDDSPKLAQLPSNSMPLVGVVDTKDDEGINQSIERLLNSALQRKPETKTFDSAVNHYRSTTQKTWAKTKEASNFLVNWRGNGPSSEVGDVVLNEKLKLKSLEASEYARQKNIDESHKAVVDKIMQLAQAVGSPETIEKHATIEVLTRELGQFTSHEEAESTALLLSNLGRSELVRLDKSDCWSLSQRQEKLKRLVDSFIDNDPMVKEITKRLHAFNQKTPTKHARRNVVQTALGAATLIPNVLAPAAQAAMLTYEMSTGGTEESKLVRELYLEKRLQSRCKTLTEEAHSAIDSYELGSLTNNQCLATVARSIMSEFADSETVCFVIGSGIESSQFNLEQKTVQPRAEQSRRLQANGSLSPSAQ